jgi:bifunctional non-homologous end joining protein LigD
VTTGLIETVPDDERRLLRKRAQPQWVEPMAATLTEERFSDPDWIFERKLDGVRVLAFRRGEGVRLYSRTRKPQDLAYPEIAEALQAQDADDLVVDGEVVAFEGRQTSFARLQGRLGLRDPDRARRTGIAVYLYLFDLVHLDGHDVSRLPLRTRKSLLRRAVEFRDPLRFLAHRVRRGEDYYREACSKGWEGLIAKRGSATYQFRRSRDWLKFKCVAEQEFVIGGWTDPQGSRAGLGALLIGYHEDGQLRYAGKVGTGFNERTLRDLRERLDELVRDDPPFDTGAALPRQAHWVEPRLVAQIGFTEWTGDGRLRHPRYLGLREDRRPRDVIRERPT